MFDVLVQLLYRIRSRTRTLLNLGRVDQDLEDEFAFHLAMQTRANRFAGMPDDAASGSAKLRFGGVTQIKKACRDEIYGSMEEATRLLRFGCTTVCGGKAVLHRSLFSAIAFGTHNFIVSHGSSGIKSCSTETVTP